MTLEMERYGQLQWLSDSFDTDWKTIDFVRCLWNRMLYEIVQNKKSGEIRFITTRDDSAKQRMDLWKGKAS